MSDVKKDIKKAERDVWEKALDDYPVETLIATTAAGALLGGVGFRKWAKRSRNGDLDELSRTPLPGLVAAVPANFATGAAIDARRDARKRDKNRK